MVWQTKSEHLRNRLPLATPIKCPGLEKHGTAQKSAAQGMRSYQTQVSYICIQKIALASPLSTAILCNEESRRNAKGDLV